MKNLLTYITTFLVGSTIFAQTTDQNYVKTIDYQIETQDGNVLDGNKIEGTVYFDGIGRKLQSVSQRAGNSGEDLVTPFVYDPYGREYREYLPYPVSNNDGEFIANPLGDLTNYYYGNFPGDRAAVPFMNPYSETRYDNSPLGRPLEIGAPGADWRILRRNDGDHTIKFTYGSNDHDFLYNFSVSFPNPNETHLPQLVYNGVHPNVTGNITKTVTKDENWGPGDEDDHHTVHEFKNQLGQVILKRAYNNGTQHNTYYVYDVFGNLTFVIPPEAAAWNRIVDSNGNLSSNYQTYLDELCYQYKYDINNRLIRKKIPGKGWEYIIYDSLDRPILTQDANLRANHQWLFTKYDGFGRVAYTGLYTSGMAKSLQDIENEAKTYIPQEFSETQLGGSGSPSNINGTDVYYTNYTYPYQNLEVLTINYYDEYLHHTGASLPTDVYGVNPNNTNVKGLATVSRVKVLDTGSTDYWTISLTGYDEKGRAIYTSVKNNYLSSTNSVRMQLDFTGRTIESTSYHYKTGFSNIITKDFFEYDQMGRLIKHTQKVDDEPVQLITQNHYDELGRLVKKDVGGQTYTGGYTDLQNVEISPNGTIEASVHGNWSSKALTKGEIPLDFNGSISATIDQTGEDIKVGFVKSTNTSQANSYYDYGIYIRNNNGQHELWSIEGTSSWSTFLTNYSAGKSIEIQREGDRINFIYDGIVEHYIDDPVISDDNLIGKLSFHYANGASMSNFELSGPNLDKKLQEIDYQYNIRGWLTDINDVDELIFGGKSSDDLFKFRINYNKLEGTNYSSTNIVPLYNGNISETIWRTKNDNREKRSYGYLYDDMNRIRLASNRKGELLDEIDPLYTFTLWNVSYDRNGNIQTLRRSGQSTTQYYDDLGYTYENINGVTTNKLLNVKDGGFDPQCGNCSGFENGFVDGNIGEGPATDDYQYDDNGNLIKDLNKGIHAIEYNHLNLPTEIRFDPVSSIPKLNYVYDATGTKLAKSKTDEGTVTTQYDNGYIYNDAELGPGSFKLEFISQPEGYIIPVADSPESVRGFDDNTGTITYSDYSYVFQYKDHLGNVRLSYWDENLDGSIDPNTEIIEENNYFPFGLKHKGYNNVINGTQNNFKTYQGKEFEQELGRDTYDFGWRDFDPAIARWSNIDPLAEVYISSSPYVFTANNPIFNQEIDGRYFEGKNEKRAARIERRAEKRAARLNKRADKLAAKGKSVGDLRDRADELTQSAQDIKDMRNDTSTEYRYGKVNSKEAKSLGIVGPTTRANGQNSKGDDVVSIFTEGNMGSKLHETRHGGQNARGEFDIKTGAKYGVADEVSAYRAQYSWKGKLDYVPFTNFSAGNNMMNFIQNGISAFKVNVTNINQINPTMVNSLVDNPGLNQVLIYPPKDASGNLLIPLSTWNSN